MGSFRPPEPDRPYPAEPPQPVLGGPTGVGTSAARLLSRDENAAPTEPTPEPATEPMRTLARHQHRNQRETRR